MDDDWCRVWMADLTRRRPVHDALLDEVERARAQSFLRPLDRARSVLGTALLKLAVAESLGRSSTRAATIRIDRRCDTCGRPHGRPRIVGSDLHASVSHSGDIVLVALTRAGPVGVDVEQHLAGRRMPPADQILAASETRSDDLLTYWCRKESVLKATGEGLRVAMTEVVVSAPAEPARLISYRGASRPGVLRDLDVGDTCAAALTVLTDGPVGIELHCGNTMLDEWPDG